MKADWEQAMANVAVIGAQWGDEGKGKIVDWLSERAEVVVRFQGGHNAGHTLVIGNQTYKLALLPSGVVREGKLSIIGNGVVVDPWHFLEEVKKVTGQGLSVTPENLKIANHAVLILPLHRDLDGWREDAPGVIKIGTTRRGIGPAYEDKVGRRAIRVGDLGEPDMLPLKVDTLLAHHNALRQGLGKPLVDAAKLIGRPARAGAQDPALRRGRLGAARRPARRRQAHPVRGRAGHHARHRPRHLSVRHLVQHGGGAGHDRHRAWATARSATCWASPRPTPRASATAPSRPSCTTRSARGWATAARSSAPTPAGRGAAAGSTR